MAEITLRAINVFDLPLIQDWRNSPAIMPHCRQYRPLSDQDMQSWYLSLNKESDYNLTNDLFMIVYKDKPIGVGGFVRIDFRNRKAELSFYVTPENKAHITDALLLLLDYGLATLNMHKIYFPVYSFNPNLEIYEKVLKREYVAQKEYYWDEIYWDRIVLVKYRFEK